MRQRGKGCRGSEAAPDELIVEGLKGQLVNLILVLDASRHNVVLSVSVSTETPFVRQ